MKSGYRLSEEEMAKRVAEEVKDGYCVNVGAGMPFMVSQFVPKGVFALFHIEHGILGVGPVAKTGEEDPDFIGLGRRALTAAPGASCFSSAEAFAMLRGGHIDMSILGAFQVSERGDLANWLMPGLPPMVGGAMDIVGNVEKLVIMMTHTTKKGLPKIVKKCSFPLTGEKAVNMVFTDIAVIEVTEQGLLLKEVAPGFSVEEVQAVTEPKLIVSADLKEIEI